MTRTARLHIGLAASLLVVLFSGAFGICDETHTVSDLDDLQSLLALPFYGKAEPLGVVDLCEAVFGNATAVELTELKHHSNLGISFCAAWEAVRRSTLAGDNIPPERIEHRSIDDAVLGNFLGFLEGRLGFNLPERWSKNFDGRTVAHRATGGRLSDEGPPLGNDATDDAIVSLNHDISATTSTPGLTLLRAEKGVDVGIDGKKYHIPEAVFSHALRYQEFSIIDALPASDKGLVCAVHSEVGRTYFLYYVHANEPAPRWTSNVWADWGMLRAASGSGYWHVLDIVLHEKRVFLFGSSPICMYIEGFDLDSGRNVCRFSTAY